MRDVRRAPRALALLAAGALLAGCGGAPEAAPPPSTAPTTSTVPSENESTQPPQEPASANGRDKRAAGAFVTHYVSLLNYASATGDTAPAREVSNSACESCEEVLAAIETVYEAGGSSEGGSWQVKPLIATKIDGGWSVDAEVRLEPQSLTPSADAAPQRFPGGLTSATFQVRRAGERWEMTQWSRAS